MSVAAQKALAQIARDSAAVRRGAVRAAVDGARRLAGGGGRGGRGAAAGRTRFAQQRRGRARRIHDDIARRRRDADDAVGAAVADRRAAMARLMQRWTALKAEIHAKAPDVNVDATAPPAAGGRGRRGQ